MKVVFLADVKGQGKKVLLAAADTFRAGAIEQLKAKVSFKVGNGGADGGLAFTQPPCRSRKRTCGDSFNKRGQCFGRVTHDVSTLSMDTIFYISP